MFYHLHHTKPEAEAKESAVKMKEGCEFVILLACAGEWWLHFIPGRNGGLSAAWCVSLQLIWYQGQGPLMDERLVLVHGCREQALSRHKTALRDDSDGWQPTQCPYCLFGILTRSLALFLHSMLPFHVAVTLSSKKSKSSWANNRAHSLVRDKVIQHIHLVPERPVSMGNCYKIVKKIECIPYFAE